MEETEAHFPFEFELPDKL